jgi:2,3-bisphosphoglycerate-dependent phosphoglycerate mutase
MKLTLIRHAESERNKRIRGQSFLQSSEHRLGVPNHLIPITDLGEHQAEEVAKNLFNQAIHSGDGLPSVIIHSGYKRAKSTAEIILREVKTLASSKRFHMSTYLDQDHLLRERDSGYGIEMTRDESRQHFPYLDNHWDLDGKWFAVPPGGESVVQVMDRVSTFLIKLSLNKELEDKHVWVVTHGRTISAFQMVIEKIPFDMVNELVTSPKNCGYVHYTYAGGVWSPE